MKTIAYIFAVLLVVIVIGIASLITADKTFEEVSPLYKNEHSQILTLASGQKVHLRDEGVKDGAPLVLLHGSNASLHTWEPWIEKLGANYRIISIDFPAHGLTGLSARDDYSISAYVEFVDEVMRALKLDQFVLGGNSMGGNVSWRYTLQFPQKVRGLILIDSSGYPVEGRSPPIVFSLLRYAPFRWLFQKISLRAAVEQGVRVAYNNSPVVTDKLIQRYVDLNLLTGYRRANASRFASRQTETLSPPPAGLINVPTLILWGKEDALIPVAAARMFNRDMPNSTLVIYNNVGHMPQEEIPGRSARDVRAFLEGMRWRSPSAPAEIAPAPAPAVNEKR